MLPAGQCLGDGGSLDVLDRVDDPGGASPGIDGAEFLWGDYGPPAHVGAGGYVGLDDDVEHP